MRSGPAQAVVILLLTGFALAHVGVAMRRALIPRTVDGVVLEKVVRHEKHPGRDDALFLRVEKGSPGSGKEQLYRVDRHTWELVSTGDRLRKLPWSTTLERGTTRIDLSDAPAVRRFLALVPIWLLPALLLLLLTRDIRRGGRPRLSRGTPPAL